MIKIAVDMDGADKTSTELVKGALKALEEISDLYLIIAGKEDELKAGLQGQSYDEKRVEFIYCSEKVTNADNPMGVLRNKKESSLVKLLNLCKNDDSVSGFVSCGSTGCILVSSIMALGRVNGLRPALCTLLPKNKGGYLIMCDCGANSDCNPSQLLSFAYMANAYYKGFYQVESPRVALLSNGAEEKKGNDLVRQTHQLLKNASDLNFVGNVEGSNILNDTCDVLVTDGFTGNVVLKNVEGSAKAVITNVMRMAKKCDDPVKGQVYMELGSKLISYYDFNSLGGAVLLGVPKVVVKGHGAANDTTFYSIIKQCYTACNSSYLEDMKKVVIEEE